MRGQDAPRFQERTGGGSGVFIAEVRHYSSAQGIAISQACYTTEKSAKGVLRQLQEQGADSFLSVKGSLLGNPAPDDLQPV
jgi:hypothetical protein